MTVSSDSPIRPAMPRHGRKRARLRDPAVWVWLAVALLALLPVTGALVEAVASIPAVMTPSSGQQAG